MLGGLAVLAGLSVASWTFTGRRAEQALAASLATIAFVAIPVHVLGWLGWLTRSMLMGSIALLSLSVIVPMLALSRPRLWRAMRGLSELAIESVRVPWRERSLALLGLFSVFALSAWTACLAYFAPSSAWDGVMYHEPMVGFALQNRGFEWVGLERANAMLGPVDGYPRVSENLMLFFAAVWDRRLIDVVPSLFLPIILLATYVLIRRFVASRTTALGMASAFALLPAILLQLRSTFVDVPSIAFVCASVAFVCRRDPRADDLWIAGLALGLLGASKITGLLIVPLLGALGLGLAIACAVRRRSGAPLVHALGGMLLVFALMAPTYVRNWTRTHNLTWPSAVEMETLGIHWTGPIAITNMNVPTEQAIRWFFGPPIPNEQHHDTKDNGYGNVPPFIIPPLAILGLFAAMRRTLRGKERDQALLLLAWTIPLLCTFALTPARHWARLNLHVVLAAWVLAAWWIGQRKRRLLAEGVQGALIIGALITLWWSEPAWDVDLERLSRLRAMPALERAAARDGIFTLMPTETVRARERELRQGDLLVFGQHPFVGLLWNERFDNRVEYIDPRAHHGAEWVREAERRGAKWAVVSGQSALAHLLRQSESWEEVGPADGTREPTIAFRRRG